MVERALLDQRQTAATPPCLGPRTEAWGCLGQPWGRACLRGVPAQQVVIHPRHMRNRRIHIRWHDRFPARSRQPSLPAPTEQKDTPLAAYLMSHHFSPPPRSSSAPVPGARRCSGLTSHSRPPPDGRRKTPTACEVHDLTHPARPCIHGFHALLRRPCRGFGLLGHRHRLASPWGDRKGFRLRSYSAARNRRESTVVAVRSLVRRGTTKRHQRHVATPTRGDTVAVGRSKECV